MHANSDSDIFRGIIRAQCLGLFSSPLNVKPELGHTCKVCVFIISQQHHGVVVVRVVVVAVVFVCAACCLSL